jgi:hypothetical protein
VDVAPAVAFPAELGDPEDFVPDVDFAVVKGMLVLKGAVGIAELGFRRHTR